MLMRGRRAFSQGSTAHLQIWGPAQGPSAPWGGFRWPYLDRGTDDDRPRFPTSAGIQGILPFFSQRRRGHPPGAVRKVAGAGCGLCAGPVAKAGRLCSSGPETRRGIRSRSRERKLGRRDAFAPTRAGVSDPASVSASWEGGTPSLQHAQGYPIPRPRAQAGKAGRLRSNTRRGIRSRVRERKRGRRDAFAPRAGGVSPREVPVTPRATRGGGGQTTRAP
jgi:hypothetical protein